MIRKAEVRIEAGGEEKTFESGDLDALIAETDSYLVSRK